MESRVSYALVGLFVIVFGLALIFAVLWLAYGTQGEVYDTYLVYVHESVAGLNPKAVVRYRGVDVGQVESIRLDPKDPRQVILTLKIQRSAPIRENTVATLKIQGLTGLATVELSGGSPDSPPLKAMPGQPYPVIKSTPSLVQRLDDAFNEVVGAVDTMSGKLDRLLSADNQASVRQILHNLAAVSGTLAGRRDSIGQTLANIDAVSGVLAQHKRDIDNALQDATATLRNSASASAQLNRLLTRLQSSVTRMNEAALSITKTSRSLDKVVNTSQRNLSQVVQRTAPPLNALLMQLGQLTGTIQQFVQTIERHPRMLLFGRPAGQPGPGEGRR